MDHITVVVLSSPTDPLLTMLDELPDHTSIAVGEVPEAFERMAPDASVIFNWSGSGALLQEVLRMCPRARWVHTRAAGLDGMLFQELIDSPVTLTNGTGVFSPSLGEFALAGILYFAKDFRRLVRNQMAGVWEQFDVEEVSGQTVGIIGYGDIGRAVASRVRALGMKVLALKRHQSAAGAKDPFAEEIFGPEGRLEMIRQCDYVVVATPLTEETRGMMGEAEFAAMKPNTVFINLGRGPVVDEPVLVRALSEGRIKGAVLDVFATEPLPGDHPFYRLENVLLSPHSADHTAYWLHRAMRFFLSNFARFENDEPLENVVDKKLGY